MLSCLDMELDDEDFGGSMSRIGEVAKILCGLPVLGL